MKRILLFILSLIILPDGVTAQSRWMTDLEDSLAITSLSIPGAHDAATSSIHGMGRCQLLTIAEQLEAGVRAFDLRPTQRRRTKGLGKIYHGMKSTGVSLDAAFADFNAFLSENPGEFVIVLLRDESDGRYLFGKPSRETFTAALRKFLETQSRLTDFRAGLRLGDCRGGIIVLCRTGSPDDFAATYASWSHSIDGSRDRRIYHSAGHPVPLAVQDCYSPKIIATDCSKEEFLSRKTAIAKDFMDYAATTNCVWVINHASAYVGTNNYCRNAAYVNPRLSLYISDSDRKPKGPTGIVMMDFAGVGRAKYRGKTYNVCGDTLLRAIIANNF